MDKNTETIKNMLAYLIQLTVKAGSLKDMKREEIVDYFTPNTGTEDRIQKTPDNLEERPCDEKHKADRKVD